MLQCSAAVYLHLRTFVEHAVLSTRHLNDERYAYGASIEIQCTKLSNTNAPIFLAWEKHGGGVWEEYPNPTSSSNDGSQKWRLRRCVHQGWRTSTPRRRELVRRTGGLRQLKVSFFRKILSLPTFFVGKEKRGGDNINKKKVMCVSRYMRPVAPRFQKVGLPRWDATLLTDLQHFPANTSHPLFPVWGGQATHSLIESERKRERLGSTFYTFITI